MKVREEQFKLVLPQDGNRSPGLHLSDVLRDLAFKQRILDAKYQTQEDNDTTLMQVGLGWEDYLAKYQHPEIVFHPGEVEKDGISMSPDGFSILDGDGTITAIDPVAWCLHEFKFTRKSSRDFAETLRLQGKKVLLWLWQIKAYALAMDTRLAKLHVMFINGNYSRDDADPESKPKYKIFALEFTREELEDNWRMIRSHAEEMRKRK